MAAALASLDDQEFIDKAVEHNENGGHGPSKFEELGLICLQALLTFFMGNFQMTRENRQ